MKASDNFKIDQAWWKKNKPITLKTTGLGAVMKKYQDLKAKIGELANKGKYSGEFDGKVTPFEMAAAILDKELPVAVAKAKSMCKPLIHKDTMTVLDKHKAAIGIEQNALQQLESNFNNTYKATYYTPVFNRATQIEQALKVEKGLAETMFKEVEAAHGVISKRLDYLRGLEKIGTLTPLDVQQATTDVKADVALVAKNCTELAKKRKSAETDQLAAAKMDGEIKGVLSFRDQDAVRVILNNIAKLKNYILDFHTRSEMYQSGVTSSFNEFKTALTGVQTKASKQMKELKTLQDTMTGNEFSTRKLENAFTNILPGLPKMIQAIKKAPDKASIETPAEVNVPPDRWVAQLTAWESLAKKASEKCDAIYKQSDEIMKKVLAKIDKAVLEDKDAIPIIQDIKSKLGGIDEYRKRCVGDYQRFTQTLKSVTTELGKKA